MYAPGLDFTSAGCHPASAEVKGRVGGMSSNIIIIDVMG